MLYFLFCFVFFPSEVHALMLSDVLVFLQEKEQKYVFAMLVRLVISLPLSASLYAFPLPLSSQMVKDFPIPALLLLALAAQLTVPTVL